MKKKQSKQKLKGGLLLLLVSIGLSVGFNAYSKGKEMEKYDNAEKVSYNEFIEQAEVGNIKEVHIDFHKDQFFFFDASEEVFETENPKYTEFKKDLLSYDIDVTTLTPSKDFSGIFLYLFQILIFGAFLLYMLKKMSPSFGDKKSSVVTAAPSVRFSDIAGLDESKADIEHLVSFLKNPKSYVKAGAKLPKGVVFYGPPGTGKTLTAKAIAGEAKVPFLSVSGSDFIEMYAGLGARRVRNLFKEAREKAPCILFIDEIDAIGGKRQSGPNNGEANQTINALLAEMDGFSTKEGIVVMAATNRIEDLDEALIRAGRFDRHVAINLPDMEARKAILKLHTKNKKLSDDVNMEEWAKMTIGFSGATLEMLMNEAAIQAVNRGSSIISTEDIDEAYYKTVMKGSKKKRGADTDFNEVKLVAYHEAGHALVAKTLTTNDVPRVTIVPSTSGAGGVTFNIPKKMGLLSKKEYLANIKVLYAGRAAEEILTGSKDEVTTGASSDIDRATQYIMAYFEQYGFSDEYGMLQLARFSDSKLYIKEAKELSSRLYNETLEYLRNKWTVMTAISEELMEKEALTGEDLDRLIG